MIRPGTIAALTLLAPALAGAQIGVAPGANAADLIANAMSAAPSSLAAHATIMGWPNAEGAPMTTLREGTNGWVCYPDNPMSDGNDPMCLDPVWQEWMGAYMEKRAPRIERLGFGYMVALGGAHGSNTDPFATGPTTTNEWGYDPPHLMLLVPDPAALEGVPTDRASGGPWVMWRGTPYAHIMVPLEGKPGGR